MDLDKFIIASKTLDTPIWKNGSGVHSDYSELRSSISVEGVTLEGYQFVGQAHIPSPDRRIMFQLMAEHSSKLKPVTRIEWRGSPHTNRNAKFPIHRLTQATETHIHSYQDNLLNGEPFSFSSGGELPVALPLVNLEDYASLLELVSERFYINNIKDVGEPPWSALLIGP